MRGASGERSSKRVEHQSFYKQNCKKGFLSSEIIRIFPVCIKKTMIKQRFLKHIHLITSFHLPDHCKKITTKGAGG